MLNIYFGDMPEAIYNTSVYFDNSYQDDWITDDLTVKMIKSIDKSEVKGANVIISPVLGGIPVTKISGGVKTLILVSHDKSGHVFNASTCGDNCAKWLLEIGKTRDVTINLRHMMDFGKRKFEIKVLNNNETAHNMSELVTFAGEYVWR
ncbi:MAG: DUF4869 domain-containing protein [Ruminococcus sp.]|nr:DUF4869 domain-containing protein [Ruminococcus sp.]MBP3794005.1 DUF4869 domain-containing protein [Ruminococcus sp.]MBQ9868597.1 DUF4869 domain-containing protein [Ruminococcus sp.]